jgi:hypothetical protein
MVAAGAAFLGGGTSSGWAKLAPSSANSASSSPTLKVDSVPQVLTRRLLQHSSPPHQKAKGPAEPGL